VVISFYQRSSAAKKTGFHKKYSLKATNTFPFLLVFLNGIIAIRFIRADPVSKN
jgi:hypothetical protein